MQVETYEIDEVKEESVEMSQEAIELAESMGLEGQLKLVTEKKETQELTRFPYRRMKREEEAVFKVLCPCSVPAKEYSAGPMPLRVLQILAHAQSLSTLTQVSVWYADAEEKDPVLVAIDGTEAYRDGPYILARWGEELDAWPQLVKKALIRWRERTRAALEEIKVKVERDLALLESATIEKMRDHRSHPTYYGIDL